MGITERRQRERAARTEAILHAAYAELYPDPTLSMDAIARLAEVAKATVYNYFSSKEALELELATRIATTLAERVAQNMASASGALLAVHHFAAEHRNHVALLVRVLEETAGVQVALKDAMAEEVPPVVKLRAAMAAAAGALCAACGPNVTEDAATRALFALFALERQVGPGASNATFVMRALVLDT